MENCDKIILSGKLTAQDYIDYNKLHSKLNNTYILMLLVILFYVLITSITDLAEGNSVEIFPTIPLGLVFGALVVLSSISRSKKLKQIFNSDKLISREYSYEIDASGILTTSAEDYSKIKWSDVYDYKKNNKMYVIYVGKNRGFILPKAFFKDSDSFHGLGEIIAANFHKQRG